MIKHKKLPSHEFLLECFEYDKDTGILSWITRPEHHFKDERTCNNWNNKKAYTPVNLHFKSNYHLIAIDGEYYGSHRIIWKLVTGNEPLLLDHIDNDSLNNKWDNLREVTLAQSNQNRSRTNTPYKKGVTYRKNTKRYRSQIDKDGVNYELGTYLTEDEAFAAYCTAARHLHGEYAHYGDSEPIFNDELPKALLKTGKRIATLSLEFIHECVSYNEDTGQLSWKRRPYHHYELAAYCDAFNRKNEGRIITGVAGNGYINFAVDGKKYYAHRIIWKIMTGTDPEGTIEHIDGNKLNNKFENLQIMEVGNGHSTKTELVDLSVEYLKECIAYNPDTGFVFWKDRPLHHFKNKSHMQTVNEQCAGKRIDMVNSHGYIRFTINRSTYLLHRVIWKLMTGYDSELFIDHIDTNRLNNKWKNLRETDAFGNACNKNLTVRNSSGYKGVYWNKNVNGDTWTAYIAIGNGVRKNLGTFSTPEDAHKAYCEAASAYHGEFANFG